MSSLADLDRLVSEAGPWLVPLLVVASTIEYVFPPFPGDTITLVGATLAVRRGEVPVLTVFVACLAGSALGAIIDYRFGGWLGRRLAKPGHTRWRRWLPPERLARVEAQYRRFGPWLILANRFVPGTRAFFFVFAGMSEVGLVKTVALGLVSAAAWNALVIAAGLELGANLERVERFVRAFNRGAIGVAIAVVAMLAMVWWRRRRTRSSDAREVG